MTTYYVEGGDISIVSFETDPQDDIHADARIWHPANEDWVDCPGSKSSVGASVLWSGDYYPIPEAEVPEFQERCRRGLAGHRARNAARDAPKD